MISSWGMFARSSGNVVFAMTPRGLYRSGNGGADWNLINSDITDAPFAIDLSNSDVMYFASGDELLRTVAERVNKARLFANAIEAAEQCGILWVPAVAEPEPLPSVLDHWDAKRLLVFADEAAPITSPLAALRSKTPGALAVLIGPEGGFEEEERALLLGKPFVLPISLGPRVMRADTAAVAALALVNATIGDWRS